MVDPFFSHGGAEPQRTQVPLLATGFPTSVALWLREIPTANASLLARATFDILPHAGLEHVERNRARQQDNVVEFTKIETIP